MNPPLQNDDGQDAWHGAALRNTVRRSVIPLAAGSAEPLPAGAAAHSDYDLNPSASRPEDDDALRAAAVLIPIVEHPGGATVLFTQRTAHLNAHAGQVSFPGGRLEPHDRGPVDAALRETQEETGIAPSFVEVAGLLDDYETVTRFRVTPVVSFVQPGFELEPDPFEVAEVFEVPLAFLMDPGNQRVGSRMRNGVERHYYAFNHGGFEIWGATAGMLMNFYRRMSGAAGHDG